MSSITYNHAMKLLTLLDKSGVKIGAWPANNNVDSSVGLSSLPNGIYQFQDRRAPHRHPGDASDGPYGPAGIVRLENFHFRGSPHEAVGIHAGRKRDADGAGRVGVNHATLLCIRTTDYAMSMINMTMRVDPLETLIVVQSSVTNGFVNSAARRGG